MSRNKPVTTGLCEVKFTVSVDWPAADVDAVYQEIGASGSHKVAPGRTPTAASVDRFLHAVWQDEPLKGRGIEVDEWCGLMMGCASVTFKVPPERAPELPELVGFAEGRMRDLRRRHVRYHRPGREIHGSNVIVTC